MKNYSKIILITLAMFGLAACGEEFLDLSDPNAVAADNFLSTETDVEVAVNGIYTAIRHNNALGEGSGVYTDERSDDMGRNDKQSNAGEPFQFNDFSLLPGNTYLKNHWAALYTIVTRANNVINNIDEVAYTNEELKSNHLAQARFLRALAYYHLVRKWGAVPVVTEQIETPDQLSEVTFRVEEAKVYELIIADLQVAIGRTLPNHQPLSGKGKVSKVGSYALLGEVYLTMGSNKIVEQDPMAISIWPRKTSAKPIAAGTLAS
jgi:hypothetical protein